jgi:TonB family protein
VSVVVLIVVFSFDFLHFKKVKTVQFEVIENPVVPPPNLILQPKSETKPVEPVQKIPENTQKVFGLSRKAITTTKSDADTVSVKPGNTVAKEIDDLKLKESDPDSIPIPADDYLITSGPKLLSIVQANRTDEARKAGYAGTAILMILIDQNGVVREVKLLNKLDFGLGEKAVEIAKTLQFVPAKIKDSPVATRIRFSINFKNLN